jgi:hypothetical protein
MTSSSSAQSLNDELTARYRLAFEGWPAVADLHANISQPQLLNIPGSYLQSEIRLMIIGQESAGWGADQDPTTEEGRTQLRAGYADFDLALETRWRGTPFWQAAYKLRERLNPGGAANAFLWSNLVPVSERLPSGKYGRPSSKIADGVCALGLIAAEIEVARPQVIAFFSGRSRDAVLRRAFPRASLIDVTPDVVEIQGLPGNPVAYRIEHPHTLRVKKKWPVLDQVADFALKAIKAKKGGGENGQ